jgi:hypothetical protein
MPVTRRRVVAIWIAVALATGAIACRRIVNLTPQRDATDEDAHETPTGDAPVDFDAGGIGDAFVLDV